MTGQKGKKNIIYSNAELAWIKKHRTLARRVLHQNFCAHFNRRDIVLDNIKALCTRKGWKTGRNGRYPVGVVPANKGKKMPYNPNSARTRFKKGQQPPNTKFLGHERISKDGYVEISINEKNPHTGFNRRYVLKHKYLWEKNNGAVPAGMCLKCLDGNRLNIDPLNWELIPRALLPFMNGHRGPDYDSAALEVKPVVLALAKLKHAKFSKARTNQRKHA